MNDPDDADSLLNWQAEGQIELTVSIDAQTHFVTITPPNADWVGRETIRFIATDPGGLWDDDYAVFSADSVNDAPRFTGTLPRLEFAEDNSLLQQIASWYPYVDDPDNADSTLSFFVLDSSSVWAEMQIESFLFQASANWFGQDSLRLRVTDGELSDTTYLRILVQPVNDPPIINGLPDSLSFHSGDTAIIRLSEYEEDVDSAPEKLRWTASPKDTFLLTDYDEQTKQLSLYAPDFSGRTCLYLTLEDDSSAQAIDSIAINVKRDTTSLKNDRRLLLRRFELAQNYPNPFNPTTVITYSIDNTQGLFVDVNLSVYNIMGQKIATLVNRKHTAGQYKAKWDAQGLSSGIYFYRLVAGKYTSVKKMILMR